MLKQWFYEDAIYFQYIYAIYFIQYIYFATEKGSTLAEATT